MFIYLWRKVVCFVLQLWDPLNWDASDCVLAGFGKFLTREGCMGLVPCRLDLQCKSSWILNDFLMKMKLNHSWKFQRNWNVPLVLLERSRWAGFNGIYLVRFGFRMWEILIFKWFLLLKIQNKFPKTRLWKEKSVEEMVAQHLGVIYKFNGFWWTIPPLLTLGGLVKGLGFRD